MIKCAGTRVFLSSRGLALFSDFFALFPDFWIWKKRVKISGKESNFTLFQDKISLFFQNFHSLRYLIHNGNGDRTVQYQLSPLLNFQSPRSRAECLLDRICWLTTIVLSTDLIAKYWVSSNCFTCFTDVIHKFTKFYYVCEILIIGIVNTGKCLFSAKLDLISMSIYRT